MEASAMPGGAIPRPPFRPPVPPLRSPSPAASLLRPPAPPVRSPWTATEQSGQAAGDLEQDPAGCFDVENGTSGLVRVELQAGGEVLRSRPSSNNKRKQQSGEACGEPQRSGDVCEEQTMARKRAQSYARSPTLKSPSLHVLSHAAEHGTSTSAHDVSPAANNVVGSKRRSRRLTSVVWNDAEPIYMDGFLRQGQCKHCKTIFPASRTSGTSQITRHLKVCKVKRSMDGVIQQSTTSDDQSGPAKFFKSLWDMCHCSYDVNYRALELAQETRRRQNEHFRSRNIPVPDDGPDMNQVPYVNFEMPPVTDEMFNGYSMHQFASSAPFGSSSARQGEDEIEEEAANNNGDDDDALFFG